MTLLTAIVWLVTGAAVLAVALTLMELCRSHEARIAALEERLATTGNQLSTTNGAVVTLQKMNTDREREVYAIDKDVGELCRRANIKRYAGE